MGKEKRTVSRRDLLKIGGIAAASAVGVSALSACGQPANSAASGTSSSASTDTAKTFIAGHLTQGLPSFLQAPAAITDIAETKEYDVVVVGAGASGVTAALSAVEEGATVALIQRESTANSNGNSGTGIDLSTSDPAGVQALIALLMKDCQYRPSRALVEKWAYNSGEAVKWVIERATEGQAQVIDQQNAQAKAITTINGYSLNYVTSFFGPKPYTVGQGMIALAGVAEKSGVEIFYSTRAKQLVSTDAGVTGVIAEGDGGNIQFNAKKGVILATGDYMSNTEMTDYYVPDVRNFGRKQFNRDGDGHQMAVWAGGMMEPIGHCKMLHDFDAGPASMADMPFLAVTEDGKRFCNEETPMSLMNNFLRDITGDREESGWYSQIFDNDYMTQAAGWPGGLVPPEGMLNYMPDEPGDKVGVLDGFTRTFKADTIEELATKINTDPVELKKSIDRYNELCAKGTDDDFGKNPKFLTSPVKTAPFWGIHRWLRVSALCSGIIIDENNQVLDSSSEPITGLYAVGNTAGLFYSGVDYPMTLPGYNLGHCYTQGRLTGKLVASL